MAKHDTGTCNQDCMVDIEHLRHETCKRRRKKIARRQ